MRKKNKDVNVFQQIKFDEKTSKYVEVINDYNVSIITTTNESGLNTLVINIKNVLTSNNYSRIN